MDYLLCERKAKRWQRSSFSSSTKNGQGLYYASQTLRNDKQVVLEAVKNKGIILKYASARLRKDKDVVIEAIKQNKKAKEYILSDELKNDEDILKLLE